MRSELPAWLGTPILYAGAFGFAGFLILLGWLHRNLVLLIAAIGLMFCAVLAHGQTVDVWTAHSITYSNLLRTITPPTIIITNTVNVPVPCTLTHCPPPVTDPPNVIRVGPTRTYKTLQAGINVANAGALILADTNAVYAGFYTVRDGTADKPITLRGDGGYITINSRNAQTIDNVNIEGHDYIVVEWVKSINSQRHGLRAVQAKGTVFRNCQALDAAHTGILTGQCLAPTVENCIGARAKYEHGIYIGESGGTDDNPIIRGCEAFGNYGNGIQINGNGPGDATIKGALVEGNKVHNNRLKGLSLIGMTYSTVSGNTISNNATAGTAAAGIHLAKDPQSGPSSYNNTVVSNTVYETRMAAIRYDAGATNNLTDWNRTRGGIVNGSGGAQRMGTHNTVIP